MNEQARIAGSDTAASEVHTPPAQTPPAAPASTAGADRWLHGLQGRLTGGVSPFALWQACADWASHLANAPSRRAELATDAFQRWVRLFDIAAGGEPVQPAPGDHRFTDPGWKEAPFDLLEQGFLLAEDWMERATTGLPGVSVENGRIVNFAARQWLDMVSPSNLPWANPEILARTAAEGGKNLLAGYGNLLADLGGRAGGSGEALRVGRDLAVTPGKVIWRDTLFELIQYAPATETVHAEPVLIVPAWIMKYYILDLSPHNSLIRYLVEQGHSVFCMSWRNPGADLRDTGFDDYRRAAMTAIEAASAICGGAKVHAAGYCLGGTLLAVTAAAMARDGDERLASVTLFAAQTDFSEAGELQLFITEDQLAFLEDVMAAQGYLDGRQMGGAFQLLRSRDLIWSRLLRSYFLGEQEHANDLMTWNDDATRMPARMHSEYLRRLFLRNDLAAGRFEVEGKPIALSDIHLPFFVVGTETDHVAPWRSVYKLHLLNPGEISFVLTSGGHNAGIVSEPGHPRRHFRIARREAGAPYADPASWAARAEQREGSWWPAWQAWLAERSGPRDASPPAPGSAAYPPLTDAPGSYILER